MRKEILVHIGTHKTGTTSIQNFLATNRADLKKVGIYFPRSGTLCEKTGHHNIAWEISGHKRFNKKLGTIEDLLTELSANDFKKVLVSSEDLEYLTKSPDKIKKLDDALHLSGLEINYLVIFRKTESYAKSLFFELKKRGLESDFETFRRKISIFGYVSYPNGHYFEFNRSRFISQWENAIRGKLLTIDYDDANNQNGVLAAFLEKIEADKEIIKNGHFAKRLNKTKFKENLYFYITNIFKHFTK